MILRHVNIEPTNKCQLNCWYCGDRKERKIGFMDVNTFKRIIMMIPTRTEVRLFLSGEPFLHPSIIEMIGFAASKGHAVLIHSNGVSLDKQLAEDLVGLSFLFPSSIFINFTMHSNKVPEGVDYLINNNGFLHITVQKIIPYPEPLEIPEYMKKYEGHVSFNLRYPHNWDKKDSIEKSEKQEYKGVCGFLEDSVAIYWDGTVTTCCADLNGDRVIGNIKERWDSIEAKYDKLAKTFGEKSHICKGCERYAETTG